MDIVVYDKSFEGFLTAVFEVYEYKFKNPVICSDGNGRSSLFGTHHITNTDNKKSERVWSKLDMKLSKISMTQLYKTFLSDIPGIENNLILYIQYVIVSKHNLKPLSRKEAMKNVR